MQSTQRYVIFSFLVLGVVAWATVAKILAGLAAVADVTDPTLLGSNFTLTSLIGLVVAGVAGVVAYKNEKAVSYCHEVANELNKVTWPDKKEVRTATVVVIVTTIIVSLLLGLFDVVWAKLTGFIYT